MELHESLYALGRSQGRELFSDAESFRGALDDYLDEDSASTGDINLLVDAVRLGAFQAMMTMLDSGADADRAVSEAGSRLARDRGSADVGGAKWALAVLGYATGKVSDVQVRSYRTQHASAPTPPPAGPPTMLPPAAPGSAPAPPPGVSAPPPGVSAPPPVVSSPPPTTPVWPSSGPNPGVPGSVAPAPAAASSYGAPPPSYGGYSHAAPPKKSRLPLLLGIVGVLVVLVVLAVLIPVVFLSDDDDKKPNDPQASSDGPTEPTTPEGPDVSFEALNERYQSLGALVTSGMDSCAAGGLQSGQTEKIQCTFPQGTLVLTTYSSGAELTAARQRRLNDKEGTIVANVESGAYYRFDPTTADPESTASPIIYWDSQAGIQSAELTGGTGINADQLDPAFEAVSATVTPPDGPSDVAVDDFNSTFTIINCTRIPTETDGESEESECRRSGRRTWVGKFHKVADLRRYRSNAKTLADQDGDIVVDYWYTDANSNGQQDSDEPEQGKIFGYIEEQDTGDFGVLYIDDLDCRCYLQMYDKGKGDPQKLYDLIFG